MLKRLFDILFSASCLVILGPLFIIIAVIIKCEDGGPVFYRGIRIGRSGRPFRIFKFRTMVVNAEKIGPSSTAKGDTRITGIGRVLRSYKIDELPQLINILKGDMSVVGPRPQVGWAVELYTDEEKRILLGIKPGITDYASIKFSNEDEILAGSPDPDKCYMEKIHPEKMRLSMEYAKNMSIGNDLIIILKTLFTIARKGNNHAKKETAA